MIRTGLFRYVRHADAYAYMARGWMIVRDLGLPGLVPGEQVDVLDGDLIVYQLRDGARWVDGEGRVAG